MNPEITAIWEKIASLEKTISDFIDGRYNANREIINENSEAEFDLAEVVSDLETRVENLEGGAN